jgi:uncharacterized protein (TIGR03067 family)
MRLAILISLVIFGFNCSSTKNTAVKPGKLNGVWIPIKQEMGGKALPQAFFEKQKLIISGSAYTFIAESVDKGILEYHGDKMDIYGKEGVNEGKHFTAIFKYEYENEQLTVCYNLSGDSYPEGFETKDKPAFFLTVYKKSM